MNKPISKLLGLTEVANPNVTEAGPQDIHGREDDADDPESELKTHLGDMDDDAEDPEAELEIYLSDLLSGAGFDCSTFSESGMLTRNKGLVISRGDRQFQLTIVESTRRY